MILCELLRLLQPRSWGKALTDDDIIAVFYEGCKAMDILESWGLEDMADFNIFGE